MIHSYEVYKSPTVLDSSLFFFIFHCGIMGLRKMINRKMISNSAYPRLFLKATMTTAIILFIINLGPTTLSFLLPMNNTAAT